MQLKTRKLYRIKSRNLRLGVFNSKTDDFLGLKYGSIYRENGVDTFQSVEELPEELPQNIENEDTLGVFCSSCGVPCVFVPKRDWGPDWGYIEDVGWVLGTGQWHHAPPPGTSSLLNARVRDHLARGPEVVQPAAKENQKLRDWLVAMEAKYPF